MSPRCLPRDPRSDQPVPDGDVPAVLYHVTTLSNLPSILGTGLRPRTRSLIEDHPERVYLTPSPARALSLCWQLRWAMIDKGLAKRNRVEDFVILAVRTDRLDAGLRWDGSSVKEGGVYAEAVIAPDAIRHVETVDGRGLLAANAKRVWDWAVWGRPKPVFVERLGTTTGNPGWTGWRSPEGGPEVPLDVDATWDEAPAPRP